jgi:hypothetical protein
MNTLWAWVKRLLRTAKALWQWFKHTIPRIILLLIILGVLGILGVLFSRASFLINRGRLYDLYGMNYPTLESYTAYIALAILSAILISLPALLILTYRAIRFRTIRNRAEEDLTLCGVGQAGTTNELKDRMQTFAEKNSLDAFIWPTLIATILLALLWGVVLIPRGLSGAVDSLSSSEETTKPIVAFSAYTDTDGILQRIEYEHTTDLKFKTLDFTRFLRNLTDHSSTVSWAFLGAYFYILMALIRRWLHSDLTAGFLWRVNLRLVVVLILGLLLTMMWPVVQDTSAAGEGTLSTSQRRLMFFAFIGGIVPDVVLSWLTGRVKALMNIEGNKTRKEWASDIFTPSALQQEIDGLNFWQADRLFDEGIESIRNLAVEPIPDLLVNTRFDTPRLVDWIDQALLRTQVGQVLPIECFRAIGVKTASDLLDIWEAGEERQKTLVQTLIVARQEVLDKPTRNAELAALAAKQAKAALASIAEASGLIQAVAGSVAQVQSGLSRATKVNLSAAAQEAKDRVHEAITTSVQARSHAEALAAGIEKARRELEETSIVRYIAPPVMTDAIQAGTLAQSKCTPITEHLAKAEDTLQTASASLETIKDEPALKKAQDNLKLALDRVNETTTVINKAASAWEVTKAAMSKAVAEAEKIEQDANWANAAYAMVENIVDGLKGGANLGYIRTYWENVNPEKRSQVLASLYEERAKQQDSFVFETVSS